MPTVTTWVFFVRNYPTWTEVERASTPVDLLDNVVDVLEGWSVREIGQSVVPDNPIDQCLSLFLDLGMENHVQDKDNESGPSLLETRVSVALLVRVSSSKGEVTVSAPAMNMAPAAPLISSSDHSFSRPFLALEICVSNSVCAKDGLSLPRALTCQCCGRQLGQERILTSSLWAAVNGTSCSFCMAHPHSRAKFSDQSLTSHLGKWRAVAWRVLLKCAGLGEGHILHRYSPGGKMSTILLAGAPPFPVAYMASSAILMYGSLSSKTSTP